MSTIVIIGGMIAWVMIKSEDARKERRIREIADLLGSKDLVETIAKIVK